MNMAMNEQSSPLDPLREQVSALRKQVFRVQCQFFRVYTFYIEKTINYPLYRWLVLVLTIILYARRIFHVQGFYLITYTLALYLLNLLLGFLSPLVEFCFVGLWTRKYMMTIRPSFLHVTPPNIDPSFVVCLSSLFGRSLLFKRMVGKTAWRLFFCALHAPCSPSSISLYSGRFWWCTLW